MALRPHLIPPHTQLNRQPLQPHLTPHNPHNSLVSLFNNTLYSATPYTPPHTAYPPASSSLAVTAPGEGGSEKTSSCPPASQEGTSHSLIGAESSGTHYDWQALEGGGV